MAALGTMKSPAKFYRCGICTNDYPTLSACVAHIRTHVTETDPSPKTAGPAAGNVPLQPQASEPDFWGEKYSDGIPALTTEPNTHHKLGSLPALTQSSSINRAPSVQNFSNSTRTVTASVPAASCKSKSILVQTDVCGTVSVRAESRACMAEGRGRKTTAAESCVGQDPVRKATPVESSMWVGQGQVRKSTPVESSMWAGQGQVRKANDASVGLPQVKVAGEGESFCGHNNNDDERMADEPHNVNNGLQAEGFRNKVEDVNKVNGDKEGEGFQRPSVVVTSRSRASHEEDRPYACPECPCRYRFLSSLSVHKKRHFGSQPYQCKTCKKKFWHPTNLRVHERTHSQERPYQCKHCGHGFNQSNDLRIHTRIHTGELPLKCPAEHCDRAFRDPACLRRHVNKHTGVQPHIHCDQCQARFYHMSALERHYRKHTGQKDFVCDICSAAFARSDTLKLHKRVHSGQKPYTCSACGAHFSDRSYCRRHMRAHRGEQNARVIANLRGKCAIKQEPVAAAPEGKEAAALKVPAVPRLPSQPSQKRRPATVIPVEIPDPDGSDIPYASIEIEIPESDLADGDDSEDIVYQYGDMLITISRSAMGLAEESASQKENPTQHSVQLHTEAGPLMEATVPFNHRQTEHQYSRVNELDKSQHKHVDLKSGQAVVLDSAGHERASLDQTTDSCGMTAAQPLSEYNEIVTSIMESQFANSKGTHLTVLSAAKGKQRNPRVGERRWPCADCNAAFFHQAELRRHRTKHTGELPYQCTICGKKVRDPSNLKRHIRTHTGERPYKCQVCDKSFSQAGHLTAHLRIHTGQRPFTCDRCPATFIEANHLRYHQKVHDGIKPFKCSECDLCFIRNAELRRHMRVHGTERPYKCDQCPAKYFRMDALKQHLSMKHQQKRPFRCDLCPQSFFKQSHLDRHRAHFKHQGGKRKDKATDLKSDAVNSVVADALCELATGRRSSVINVKGSSVISSSSESTTAVALRHSGQAAVTRDTRSSAAGATVQVKTISAPAPSKTGHNSALVGSSTLLMEEEIFGEGRNDESFVQRVMVDGGSVTGARVVMLESSQAMEVDRGSKPVPSTSLTQTVHDGCCVAAQSNIGAVVVDTALQHQTPAQQVVIEEQPTVMDESGYIIIGEMGHTIHQVVHNGPVYQQPSDSVGAHSQSLQQHPNPVSDLQISEAVVSMGSMSAAADHQYVHLVEGVSADVAQAETAPSQAPPSGSLPASTETEMQSADSALESTMRSLLSGATHLESVKSIVREHRAGGRPVLPVAGVVIKEEVQEAGEEVRAKTPSFVAPLKTRSGRERKIKVKFSA